MSGTPELEPVDLGPEHRARVDAAMAQAGASHLAGMERVANDALASARRLAAEAGMPATADVYGDHCVNPTCDGRWALPADKATCAHKPICEDCWPNGCEACIAEVEADLCRRDVLVHTVTATTAAAEQAVLDLADSDLAALDWRQQADLRRAVERGQEALRHIGDRLRAKAEARS